MSALATQIHANAVRIPPSRLLTETRTVIVHLTPFAPGCATASVGDRARNRTFWERPVGGIIRAILTRLNRVPSTVRVETDARGDPALSGEVDPYGPVPLVFFWEGLTVPEIADGLGELARRGWAAQLPSAPNLLSSRRALDSEALILAEIEQLDRRGERKGAGQVEAVTAERDGLEDLQYCIRRVLAAGEGRE